MRILKDVGGCDSRDRLSIVAYAAAASYVLVCAYARAVSLPLPSLCPWRAIGAYCPGCGMTRAVQHAMHFEFAEAWNFNKMIVILLPIFLFTYVRVAIDVYKRVKTRFNRNQ
jgi:hypothetical protein